MGIREDAKQIFNELFGPEVAKQIDAFDSPDQYPKDFLDECEYFLGKLIGESPAKKMIETLRKKYLGSGQQANKKAQIAQNMKKLCLAAGILSSCPLTGFASSAHGNLADLE